MQRSDVQTSSCQKKDCFWTAGLALVSFQRAWRYRRGRLKVGEDDGRSPSRERAESRHASHPMENICVRFPIAPSRLWLSCVGSVAPI